MDNQFIYGMPTKICFGVGAAKKVADYIDGDNVLIISDPFLYNSGIAKALGDCMKGKKVVYFSEIEPNPSCESVDKAAALAREMRADCVLGLGGGSSLDVAKIVSCLVTNEGSVYDYYAGGTKKLGKRSVQLICVPTTAGTGSEVTNVAVFTNNRAGIKMPMVNQMFWPDYAVIDAELTYTLPSAVTASTGMDAFCHAIEAYWNKESQPICDMLAMEAMKLILNNIEAAYQNPSDSAARCNMMKASLFAGVAFSQTRTTGIHALSFPLTTEFHASHGTACSITLPAFIKKAQEGAADKLKVLAYYLGYKSAEDLSEEVEGMMKRMNMPTRLHELGITESDLKHITKVGLEAAIIQLTPAVMNEDTVYALLKDIL